MKDDEINFTDLLIILWNKKVFITTITLIGILLSVIYSLSLPNIYKSEALMIPASDNQSSNMISQYSGLAGLAGISMPTSNNENKTLEAIEIIKSFDFFSKYFLPFIDFQNLMAVENWDRTNNVLIYDENLYDNVNNKWIKNEKHPMKLMPSEQEAYDAYLSIMNISRDKKSLFVTLSFKHQSPYLAKEWTALVISQINKIMRNKDKQKVSKSIDFLNSQSSKVTYGEVKQALSILLQDQIKSLMLIEANDDYVFEIINSPLVAEKKTEPIRSQFVILSALVSLIFSVLFVLFRHFSFIYFKEKK